MEEKMTCPNCHSSSIKKKTGKKSKEALPPRLHNPKEENVIFECLSCGKVFDRDDLLNIEMEEF